jgi:hypothetical protein
MVVDEEVKQERSSKKRKVQGKIIPSLFNILNFRNEQRATNLRRTQTSKEKKA